MKRLVAANLPYERKVRFLTRFVLSSDCYRLVAVCRSVLEETRVPDILSEISSKNLMFSFMV